MEKSIKHILLATDFSGYSNQAYQFALHLAKKKGAKITLLHVIEPPYNFATAVEGMLKIMENNALSNLKQLIKNRDSKFENINIQPKVAHGRTAREIVEQIKQLNTDVVVMGSKGQSSLERVVFGSVSAVVAVDSPVAVFLIPEREQKNWEIQNILFTTNLRERDPDNLEYAQYIASLFDAKLDIIHVLKNRDFDSQLRINGFKQLINERKLDVSTELNVKEHSNILVGIAEHLADNPNSLVILNRYKRSMLQKLFGKNHTKEMMEYSKLPLLILP